MTATDTVRAALATMTPPYSGQCETVRETLARMAQNDEATRTIINTVPGLLAAHEADLEQAVRYGHHIRTMRPLTEDEALAAWRERRAAEKGAA